MERAVPLNSALDIVYASISLPCEKTATLHAHKIPIEITVFFIIFFFIFIIVCMMGMPPLCNPYLPRLPLLPLLERLPPPPLLLLLERLEELLLLPEEYPPDDRELDDELLGAE
jgi:hypothetical protein